MKKLAALMLVFAILPLIGAADIRICPDILSAGNPLSESSTGPSMSRATFLPLQVLIDPHGKSLAVYQVQIEAVAGDVMLVGVEGGDGSFEKAPYYDPAALAGPHKRIVFGAYSLGDRLPSARTRVATLMFRVAGPVQPLFRATLVVAASTDATAMPATVSFAPQAAAQAHTQMTTQEIQP